MKKLSHKEVSELKTLYKVYFKRVLEEKLVDLSIFSEEDKAKHLERMVKDQERLDYIGKILDENKTKVVFSPDTLLIVGANLIGILLILNYEKLDIVSSKAVSFILKARVWKDSFLFSFALKTKLIMKVKLKERGKGNEKRN